MSLVCRDGRLLRCEKEGIFLDERHELDAGKGWW